MSALTSRSRAWLLSMTAALVAGLIWVGCGQDQGEPTAPGNQVVPIQELLKPAINVQALHTDRLLAMPGIVGTAVGLTAAGKPAVKVYTEDARVAGLPQWLDGVPVVVEVTGELVALQASQKKPPGKPGKGGGGGNGGVDPTGRFVRPVPIGISTGSEGQCSAGTIGARVTNGASVFALSNNHVYALENNAAIPSNVLQPGRIDADPQCAIIGADVFATLSAASDFVQIKFDGTDNTIDAAIALSSTADLGKATPSNGYIEPKSATVAAVVGQAVQKYGRTSSLTKGSVSGIHATVNVRYSSGTARFVDQIIVSGEKGGFIKAGDSGSLLVTDPGKNPVGLLFAGGKGGKTAIANRIDLVLAAFTVTIDGE